MKGLFTATGHDLKFKFITFLTHCPEGVFLFVSLMFTVGTYSMFSGLPVSVQGLSNMPPLSVRGEGLELDTLHPRKYSDSTPQFCRTQILAAVIVVGNL